MALLDQALLNPLAAIRHCRTDKTSQIGLIIFGVGAFGTMMMISDASNRHAPPAHPPQQNNQQQQVPVNQPPKADPNVSVVNKAVPTAAPSPAAIKPPPILNDDDLVGKPN